MTINIANERAFAIRAHGVFDANPCQHVHAETLMRPGALLALRWYDKVMVVRLDENHQPTIYERSAEHV